MLKSEFSSNFYILSNDVKITIFQQILIGINPNGDLVCILKKKNGKEFEL